jgi:nitrite reductase/ring-hydroxylating ferredoxin subunit
MADDRTDDQVRRDAAKKARALAELQAIQEMTADAVRAVMTWRRAAMIFAAQGKTLAKSAACTAALATLEPYGGMAFVEQHEIAATMHAASYSDEETGNRLIMSLFNVVV